MRQATIGIGVLGIVIGVCAGADEPPKPAHEQNAGFSVRLLDPQNQPVEGAEVGLDAASGDANFRETGWEYCLGPWRSGRDGIARLDQDPRWLNGLSVVARHRERGLVAVVNLDPDHLDRVPTIRMRPECHVVGRLRCEELEDQGRRPREIAVNALLGRHLTAEYWSKEPEFEFFLPPGKYNLEIRSQQPGTHEIMRPLVIPDGRKRLDLGVIDVHLAEYARLEGRKAPELREVAAWKNVPSLKLADLQGKVVLLDFWGWWCGACVASMPELFDLHDKYRDRGLVIIGVHVSYDEDAGVRTVAELDRKMESTRKDVWGGRDIPFPVALTVPRVQDFSTDASRSAYCRIAADYGIENYPTMILIDRKGQVIGRLDNQDYIERIEAALSAK